jgi:hypothetical protein
MNSLWLWLKFGYLKKKFIANEALLFDAEEVSFSKFPYGNVMFQNRHYTTTIKGKGLEAWEMIVAETDAIAMCINCPKCGFNHVICRPKQIGHRAIFNPGFQLNDRYTGFLESSWFSIFAPSLRNDTVIKNELVCQSCGVKGRPYLKIYSSN